MPCSNELGGVDMSMNFGGAMLRLTCAVVPASPGNEPAVVGQESSPCYLSMYTRLSEPHSDKRRFYLSCMEPDSVNNKRSCSD